MPVTRPSRVTGDDPGQVVCQTNTDTDELQGHSTNFLFFQSTCQDEHNSVSENSSLICFNVASGGALQCLGRGKNVAVIRAISVWLCIIHCSCGV